MARRRASSFQEVFCAPYLKPAWIACSTQLPRSASAGRSIVYLCSDISFKNFKFTLGPSIDIWIRFSAGMSDKAFRKWSSRLTALVWPRNCAPKKRVTTCCISWAKNLIWRSICSSCMTPFKLPSKLIMLGMFFFIFVIKLFMKNGAKPWHIKYMHFVGPHWNLPAMWLSGNIALNRLSVPELELQE